MNARFLVLPLSFALACLSGCASSGGGGSSDPSPDEPEWDKVSGVGFERSWELDEKGSGVGVAVVDSGINDVDGLGDDVVERQSYIGLDTEWDDESTHIAPQAEGDGDLGDGYAHGTEMASLIAGDTYGVAPEADLYSFRGFGDGGVAETLHYSEPLYTNSYGDESNLLSSLYAGIEQAAIHPDTFVINYSAGTPDGNESLRYAVDSVVTSGKLLVAAAGNTEGSSDMNYPAAYAAETDYKGHILAVGAYDNEAEEDANKYTQPETEAIAEQYLLAPGNAIEVINNEGDQTWTSGTSPAAALVSGAAAIVKGRWDHLTAEDVGNILLESAEDLGEAGTDMEFGRGLLDVEAAMEPLSEPYLADSTKVADGGYTLSSTRVRLSSAGGLDDDPALAEAVAFDKYERDFPVDLRQPVAGPQDTYLADRLAGLTTDSGGQSATLPGGLTFRASYQDRSTTRHRPDPAAMAPSDRPEAVDGSWSLRGGGERLRYQAGSRTPTLGVRPEGLTRRWSGAYRTDLHQPYLAGLREPTGGGLTFGLAPGMEVRTAWAEAEGDTEAMAVDGTAGLMEGVVRFSDEAALAARTGLLREEDGFAGNFATGALGIDRARTRIMGVEGYTALTEQVDLTAGFGYGTTEADARGGLVTGSEAIASRYGHLGLHAAGEPDSAIDGFGLRLAAPMHVHQGSLSVKVPTARADDGSVVYERTEVDLARESEVVTEAYLAGTTLGGGRFQVLASVRENPAGGEVARDHSIMAAYRLGY